MSDERQPLALKGCPFCGATPHRGLTKATVGQDGTRLQRYEIWCPHSCARINEVTEELAVARWNSRAGADREKELVRALKCMVRHFAVYTSGGDLAEFLDAPQKAAIEQARAALSPQEQDDGR